MNMNIRNIMSTKISNSIEQSVITNILLLPTNIDWKVLRPKCLNLVYSIFGQAKACDVLVYGNCVVARELR